jgi:hypothetical protein
MGLVSVVCVLAAAGCGAAPAAPAAAPAGTFRPPPPLALVAIVDSSSGAAADQLRQLAAVIQAGVTPSQTLVVTLLAGTPVDTTYVVRGGDSLVSIAAAHGVSLASLQGANPQLGPLANRSWNRVYPGDRVTIPSTVAGYPARNAVVTRAPAGPPPPALVRRPDRPANATTFQDAQYRRALAAADSANRERAAAWRAEAERQVGPWQRQVVARLQELSGNLDGLAQAGGRDGDVAAAIQAGANTLAGLPGRRVLLLLAGGRLGATAAALVPSLAGIRLVVANLAASAGPAFAAAAAGGAAVTALDPALTELELPAAVNG